MYRQAIIENVDTRSSIYPSIRDGRVQTIWLRVLHDHEVDDQARMALFMLAQVSDDGRMEAFALIRKLVVERSSTNPIRNASSFVQQCSMRASQRLTDLARRGGRAVWW